MTRFLMPMICAASLANAAEPATAKREDRQVVVRAGDDVILRYQAEPGDVPNGVPPIYERGGYIQSIFTPEGKLVTDDFPPDHRHHHGVWSPWTRVRFEGRDTDFWNMGQGKGRVEFVKLEEVWEKDGKAGFEARHQFVDLTSGEPKVVLHERWQVAAWAEDDRHVIDITITQKCATDEPLELPEYHYGGLGFRGNRQWNGTRAWQLLAASGKTDRNAINTSREPWCWVGGEVDGDSCGVTILCHPENFRAPQPVRAHPSEPFFCYAPQQLGKMEIGPRDTYVAKFRLVVADGGPDAEASEAAWKTYSREK